MMSIIEKFSNWLSARVAKENSKNNRSEPEETYPLREFIYLDEVSLRSLLSSQIGDLKETTSEENSKTADAEFAAELSADAVIGSGKLNSRYQTSNSRSINTSRKAVVQSWFKDFVNDKKLEIHFSKITDIRPYSSTSDLLSETDGNLVLSSQRLKRGELIEIDVELTVDPIFKMSTLISEFLGIAQSTPEIFEMADMSQQIRDVGPANKLLQHLLTGLIPLRAKSIDYCVVCIDYKEYIVNKKAIENMTIEKYPLEIVGVTEHLSYWKDIRRVLFSAVQFTMLCRISRDGIQENWTPVKLTHLFDDVVPDLRKQVSSIGEVSLVSTAPVSTQLSKGEQLDKSLKHFFVNYLNKVGRDISESERQVAYDLIDDLKNSADVESITYQNRTFRELREHLNSRNDDGLGSDQVLDLSREARSFVGLKLFDDPTLASPTPPPSNENENVQSRLIDTEVIAIYW